MATNSRMDSSLAIKSRSNASRVVNSDGRSSPRSDFDYYSGESSAEVGMTWFQQTKLRKNMAKNIHRRHKDFLLLHKHDLKKTVGVLLLMTLGICIWNVIRIDRFDRSADVGIASISNIINRRAEATMPDEITNDIETDATVSTETNGAHNHTFEINMLNAPECGPVASTDISFTLVTQLSYDRLWMIPHHCSRWGTGNPMSIAIFTDKSIDEIRSDIEPECDSSVTIQTLTTAGVPEGDYPVNALRNLALSAVKTSHVMYVDVDFWESENLYGMLHHPATMKEFATDDKLASVIPAFQIVRMCREYYDCRKKNIAKMPLSKDDVLNLANERKLGPFDPTNRGGHGSTLYTQWKNQPEGTFLDLPCIQSNRYEPYMAFRYCRDLPPFQEAFTGYGKNKMTFVMQMRRSGYIFSQLGGAFVVHYPHLDSASRMIWNEGQEEMRNLRAKDDMKKMDLSKYKRAQVDRTFVQFKKWLRETVPDVARINMCDDEQNDDARLWVTEGEKIEFGS